MLRGKLGKKAYLDKWITTITSLTAGETAFTISFDWDESVGVPGALMIRNHHHSQFYLKTITLEDVPGHGRVHFVCNSWVYPAHRYNYDRIFFSNKVTFILKLTKDHNVTCIRETDFPLVVFFCEYKNNN